MFNCKLKRIRIPKLDEIILFVCLLQVLIVCWISLDLQDKINHLLVILIVVSLVRSGKKQSGPVVFCLLLFWTYQFLNFIILGGQTVIFLRNWYRTFKSILLIIYFTSLLNSKRDLLISFLTKNLKLFNVYALINIPILLSQRTHDFSTTSFEALLGRVSYRNSLYYSKDMMSGLFGLYGTPRLAVFISFLLFLNYIANRYIVKKRKTFDIYNCLLLAFYLWMATQNDNKGFFIMIALFLFVLYISLHVSKLQNKLDRYSTEKVVNLSFRIIVFLILITVFFLFAYNFSALFKGTIDEIMLKIHDAVNVPDYLHYNSIVGGGERFAMILFALSRPDTAIVGYGLGNYLYTSGNLGFRHFGQADVGTFICLGGSLYIILMYLLIYKTFKKSLRSSLIPPIMLGVFFILSVYTHVLMDTSITITMMWFFAVVSIPLSQKVPDDFMRYKFETER